MVEHKKIKIKKRYHALIVTHVKPENIVQRRQKTKFILKVKTKLKKITIMEPTLSFDRMNFPFPFGDI